MMSVPTSLDQGLESVIGNARRQNAVCGVPPLRRMLMHARLRRVPERAARTLTATELVGEAGFGHCPSGIDRGVVSTMQLLHVTTLGPQVWRPLCGQRVAAKNALQSSQ